MKQYIKDFYLDWVNNFISVQGMADHYGLTYRETAFLIEVGEKYYKE